MKYKECPVCGAHLDPGEKCDCDEVKNESTPAATEAPSTEYSSDTDTLSCFPSDVNQCLRLKEVRQATGVMAKDVAKVVQTEFPKFNRQLLAQCEAPEKYGVVIHPEGLRLICAKYGVKLESPGAMEITATQRKPRKEKRKLPRQLTLRMTDHDFEQLQHRVLTDGYASVQAWLYTKVQELLGGVIQ